MRTFSIRRNEKIAAHVTVRGERAEKILELGLKVKEYELKAENFSSTGAKSNSELKSAVSLLFLPFLVSAFFWCET